MTAYICQPSGRISLCVLDEMLIDRFSYVRTLELNAALPDDKKLPMPKVRPEYLCAGSAHDNTSHFLLRLASTLASSPHGEALRRTVAAGEALMWRDRAAMATPSAARTLHAAFRAEVAKETARLSHTLRHFHELDRVGSLRDRYIRFLTDLSVFLKDTESWHKDHPIRYRGGEDCDKHKVSAPWRLFKQLVRQRRVKLSAGRAELRCSSLMAALETAFSENLRLATQTLMLCGVDPSACNPHLVELADKMAALCADRRDVLPSSGLKATEVASESQFFPPCMKHAFEHLAREHNCHHDTRYQLTLFLKSVGMSLEEQLSFWRSEYSQPAPSLGKAKWNERRYVYSIRHAYGLEGKRVQQEEWGCARIQNKSLNGPGPICPFRLPAHKLAELLPAPAEPSPAQAQPGPSADFTELAASGCPSAACQAFLCATKRCEKPMAHSISSPVQYYLKNRDLMEW